MVSLSNHAAPHRCPCEAFMVRQAHHEGKQEPLIFSQALTLARLTAAHEAAQPLAREVAYASTFFAGWRGAGDRWWKCHLAGGAAPHEGRQFLTRQRVPTGFRLAARREVARRQCRLGIRASCQEVGQRLACELLLATLLRAGLNRWGLLSLRERAGNSARRQDGNSEYPHDILLSLSMNGPTRMAIVAARHSLGGAPSSPPKPRSLRPVREAAASRKPNVRHPADGKTV